MRRNNSLRENGLNYYFDFGSTRTTQAGSIATDNTVSQLVSNFQDLMSQNLSFYDDLGIVKSIGTGSDSYDSTDQLVRRILDYYRLNTDRLMINLSLLGFSAAAAGSGRDFYIKIYQTILDESESLSPFSEYRGPDLNEIANKENISF